MSHTRDFYGELAPTERYDTALAGISSCPHSLDTSHILSPSKMVQKYEDVEKALMAILQELDPALLNMNTGLGCREVVNLACQSKDAYLKFCTLHGVAADISELRDGLLRSAHLPDLFMGMSRRAWKTFNTAFATTGDETLRYEDCDIVVLPTSDGGMSFDVNRLGWQVAENELAFLGKRLDPTGTDVCPARGLFMNKFWKTTVWYLCDNPELFPADIGTDHSM